MRSGRFNRTAYPELDLSETNQVGMTLSNEIVIDRRRSHAHLYGEQLARALYTVDTQDKGYVIEEIDFGEVIGETTCVETADDDVIVYGYRHGRRGPTRFVIGREPEPATSAVVVLKRADSRPGVMLLISAWAGYIGAQEPWDRHLRSEASLKESQDFWSSHALIFDPNELDESMPWGSAEQMAAHIEAFKV